MAQQTMSHDCHMIYPSGSYSSY